ncbi:MAG: hypothetical protein ACLQVD_14390 [Capsulimonadaceae bacterium]
MIKTSNNPAIIGSGMGTRGAGAVSRTMMEATRGDFGVFLAAARANATIDTAARDGKRHNLRAQRLEEKKFALITSLF